MHDEPVRWDPFHTDDPDPYPMLKRLRDETPLYYNEEHDFYALSRYEDVENGLFDRDTFISGHGDVVDMIKSRVEMPSMMFIFEDAPKHTIHRGLFGRMFTPRRLKALEPQVREFCARSLDPLVGGGRFDFVANLGAEMPMRVIGMLLGIPESDLQTVRSFTESQLKVQDGQPLDYTTEGFQAQGFDDYLDWRIKNPSDDLMTELITLEFEDDSGVTRRMTREEILVVCNLFATAGNETTNKLIGWTGKLLGEHPDQRRQINQDRSLIPQAIEEVLRYESPSTHVARMNTRDVEFYGKTVPAGSVVAFVNHAANRDERKFEDPDTFNIHRQRIPHLTFGYAWHVCLGNPLARLEGRIALEEVLNRFPDWEIDTANARMVRTSTVRGFESLPAIVH